MGAPKKSTDLSKQIEQHEAHLGMLKREIQTYAAKRDEARVEAESAEKEAKRFTADCERDCARSRQTIADEQKRIDVEKERLAEERQKTAKERNDLVAAKDVVEMSRRDLENDKRRIGGFLQIIDQAVKAWR